MNLMVVACFKLKFLPKLVQLGIWDPCIYGIKYSRLIVNRFYPDQGMLTICDLQVLLSIAITLREIA